VAKAIDTQARVAKRSVAVVATLVALLPGLALVDAVAGGPYTHWHHDRLLSKARAAALIGQPESAVVQVLGEPSSVCSGHAGPRGELTVSLNYEPVPFLAINEFQVWVRGGRVLCVESFDRETHAFE
jgi:hypothetical protein